MTRIRFDGIVDKLHELTVTDEIFRPSGDFMDWRTGEKFKPSETGATLDELREVGKAFGLYLHHCSHCDRWYFAWFKTLEEYRRYEESQRNGSNTV